MVEAALLTVFLLAVLFVLRAGEQFRLSWRDGRLLVVRGNVPQGLLNDFADTLRRGAYTRATLVGRRDERGVRLTASGVSEWDLQRLRNQLGHNPVARLSQSGRAARRTLGTVLGITWLAWLMARPDDFV
ncbi:MAG: DUF3634 family protein [Myxococcaceae bacterium]|nr:DUF3634 family protein [Myxococcaceae bacterium]